ncbi:hypothetical protein PV341_15060 [Streptomyces sp. PA03-1a]|nr:hypothetical protein [Streptomyces sp. PA03-1a]
MIPVLVLVLAVALVVFACIFVVARESRRRALREQSYPDHVRRRLQARKAGGHVVDAVGPGAEPTPRLRQAASVGDEDDRTGQLLDELCAIGRGQGFLTLRGKDRRTREIGAELDEMGGKQEMLDAHSVVRARLGPLCARELEAAWDGVGSWLR